MKVKSALETTSGAPLGTDTWRARPKARSSCRSFSSPTNFSKARARARTSNRSIAMSDLPHSVRIHEEGPREGFQIEPGPIPTARKIEFIEALADTGLKQIDCVSFVNPKKVPGMADAEEVIR